MFSFKTPENEKNQRLSFIFKRFSVVFSVVKIGTLVKHGLTQRYYIWSKLIAKSTISTVTKKEFKNHCQ